MALTSALFTGLSGLDVNQTRLNVVGNNIANANTVAFKASRALFKPQFYVTDSAGSPSTATFGGENPSQRGLGAQVATIQKDFSAGSIEPTGKPTDLAIDGDGFFVVQGKDQRYTRDGSFTLNEANQLVTTGGDFVQGFGVDTNGNVVAGSLQDIQIPLGGLTKAQATDKASFQGNLNANGAVGLGASILNTNIALTDSAAGARPTGATALVDLRDDANPTGPALFAAGDTLSVAGKRGGRDQSALTFKIDATTTVQNLQDFMNQGLGIDTSVTPPAGAPTPGATLLDSTTSGTGSYLSIVGNVGKENALSLTGSGFTSDNAAMNLSFADAANSNPSGESVYTSFVVYDSLGTPLTVNATAVLDSKNANGTTWRVFANSPDDTDAKTFDPTAATHPGSILGTGTISFDSDGKIFGTPSIAVQMNRTATGAGTPLNVNLDFSSMTALTSGQSQLLMSQQNGRAMGTLTSFSIGSNGLITGAFDNGLTDTLGQVAMATFDNPEGLVDDGANLYSTGADSGAAKITGPLTLDAGAIRSGALELSNVDISKEFINMIIASTGFSASSRVITTSDQLLTELLNSSR